MTDPVVPPHVEQPPARRWLPWCAWAAVLLGLLTVAAVGGVRLRCWVFDQTEPIRYRGDLANAYQHGASIIQLAQEEQHLGPRQVPGWPAVFHAYLHLYDRVHQGWAYPGYRLDYPPLRLLVMTIWTRAIWQPDGAGAGAVQPGDLPACAPLLYLNMAVAAMAALGAFLLVRHWVQRGLGRGTDEAARAPRPRVCGSIAALLIWFNFAILIDAHAWPQWDIWLIPFYLWAMLAGSSQRWFTAGLIFGIGCMFKGQLLIAAPLLILWPLFIGQWIGLLRLLIGLATAVAIIESMWIMMIPPAAACAGGAIALAIIARIALRRYTAGRGIWLIAGCAAAVLLSAVVFHASFTWFQQGFIYGVEKEGARMANTGANNLASLLNQRFGWGSSDDPVTTLTLFGRTQTLTLGQILTGAYGLCIILCAIGLARHTRRNDPWALIAMAAPWVLFFALMPHMSARYLIWGAAITALGAGAGVGVGPLLLHLLLSACSGLMILHTLIIYSGNRAWWPALTRFLDAQHPDIGWAIILSAAILLYLSLTTCSSIPNPKSRSAAKIPVRRG